MEEQARDGRYDDASDCVRDLIRRDQERSRAIATMQARIDEGLRSGIDERSMEELRQAGRRAAALIDEG